MEVTTQAWAASSVGRDTHTQAAAASREHAVHAQACFLLSAHRKEAQHTMQPPRGSNGRESKQRTQTKVPSTVDIESSQLGRPFVNSQPDGVPSSIP